MKRLPKGCRWEGQALAERSPAWPLDSSQGSVCVVWGVGWAEFEQTFKCLQRIYWFRRINFRISWMKCLPPAPVVVLSAIPRHFIASGKFCFINEFDYMKSNLIERRWKDEKIWPKKRRGRKCQVQENCRTYEALFSFHSSLSLLTFWPIKFDKFFGQLPTPVGSMSRSGQVPTQSHKNKRRSIDLFRPGKIKNCLELFYPNLIDLFDMISFVHMQHTPASVQTANREFDKKVGQTPPFRWPRNESFDPSIGSSLDHSKHSTANVKSFDS